jgi:hypothetical protein
MKPREIGYTSSATCNYDETVGLVLDSGFNHPTGAREKHCYADN